MSRVERFWHEVAAFIERHLAHRRHHRHHHHKKHLAYVTLTLKKETCP